MMKDINTYRYEQYHSVWCKVLAKDQSFAHVKSDEAIIKELIEQINLYHTPESWCSHFQLQKDTWILTKDEHHSIVAAMKEACVYYQNKAIEAASKERDEYLSWYGFEGGIKALKNAPPEQQAEAKRILQQWYETSSIDEHNALTDLVFTKQDELQDRFLNGLFGKDARFYVNKTLEQIKHCLYENTRLCPAVAGIDAEKMALFWFNH